MKSLLLCALLLVPGLAQAIPVAGNYTFQAGPDLAGSFTSTGTALSAWSLRSDFFERGAGGPGPWEVLVWESPADQVFYQFNRADIFSTLHTIGDQTDPGQQGIGYIASLFWNQDPAQLNARFRVDAWCCDAMYDAVPTVAFAAVQSVPEPASLWLLGLGFLGLWGWRRCRHGRLA